MRYFPRELPRSLRDLHYEFIFRDDWTTHPCPDCGAEPQIQTTQAGQRIAASMTHRRQGCRSVGQKQADRLVELATSRMRSRWA